MPHPEFEPYLKQWNLLADGEPIITHRSRLLPVLAFAGLSAAWFLEDDDLAAAQGQLQVAQLAAQALDA